MEPKKLIEDIRACGWTIDNIAKRAGVTPMTVYRWGRAEVLPEKTIKKLLLLKKRAEDNDPYGLSSIDTKILVAELSRRGWSVTLTAKE